MHATQSDFVAVRFGGSECQKNTSVAERSHRQSFILVHVIGCDATVDFDLAVKAQNPRQDALFERLLLHRHRTTRALRTSACAAPLVASACCARFLAMVPHTATSVPCSSTSSSTSPSFGGLLPVSATKHVDGSVLCRLSANAAHSSSAGSAGSWGQLMSPPRVHTLRTKWRVRTIPTLPIKTAHPTSSRKPRLTSLCLGTMHARTRQSGGPRHATGNIGTLRRAGSGVQTALGRVPAASRACPNQGAKPQQGATW